MTIDLTEQEATALLELANIALKNDTLGGWNVFNVAGILRQKLQAAAQKELNEKSRDCPPTPAPVILPPVSESAS